jgi:hypothetical protein
MKSPSYLVVGLVAVALLYYSGVFEGQKPSVEIAPSTNIVTKQWETKSDDQPPVTITVTPIDISSGLKEWKFAVVMDTHSVELDQNLTKLAVLIDDQGKEYQPLNWEGPVGGHHREGVLVFSAVEPTPQVVEIKIKDVGGIPERSFKWHLK